MDRHQKRRRIAHLRNQQKKNKEAKRLKPKTLTKDDVVGLLDMVRRFKKFDGEFVEEYTLKAAKNKKVGIFSSIIFLLLNLSLYLELLPVSDEWDAALFFISGFFASMPWVSYFIYRERIPFWRKQFQESSEYAKALEYHFSNFQ